MAEKQQTTELKMKTPSPIRSRMRKSSEIKSNAAEVPTKRRRSSRRKSLVETLQSVYDKINENTPDGGAKTPRSHATPSLPNITEADTQRAKSPLVEQANVSADVSLSAHLNDSPSASMNVALGENNFVYEWYGTLREEARGWRKLLQHHKIKEEESRLKAASSFRDNEKQLENLKTHQRPGAINCEEFIQQVESLEQRFISAAKTVTKCVDNIHEIAQMQDLCLNDLMEKEVKQSLEKCNAKDPRGIIEDLFKYDELLMQTAFKCNSVT